jgi:ADP-heptose:LPS heptosyltransferase
VKVLCISLLRFGDLIQHAQLVDQVRAQHTDAEIHLLINDSNKSIVSTLFDANYVVHYFERSRLQKNLNIENGNVISAHFELSSQIQELKSQKFNKIFDFTNTKISTAMKQLISTDSIFEVKNQNWFNYLNNTWVNSLKPSFQLLDVLAKVNNLDFPLVSDPKLRAQDGAFKILFNVFTSDEKKNWPAHKFTELYKLIKDQYPHSEILGVAAPDEKELVQINFANSGLEFVYPKWNELADLFSKNDLIVSGDTSVLHFAAREGLSIVGIFLGSADVNKFAPRQKNSLILTGETECYPCSSRNSCHQKEHYCSAGLATRNVLDGIQHLLNRNQRNSKLGGGSMYQVHQSHKRQLRLVSNKSFFKTVEAAVWQFKLDNKTSEPVPPYATAVRDFMEGSPYIPYTEADFYQVLEHRIGLAETAYQSMILLANETRTSVSNVENPAQKMKSANYDVDYFNHLTLLLADYKENFFWQRSWRNALAETIELLEIEIKFIQEMKKFIFERNDSYVTGTGKLFELSSQEA